ncbi:MAG TPA: NAD(+) diphosphatase, partial [Solirubrobacteraceae bacterium]|nr:NAD(+) diphosphatase [Solirubrobacteraceae bacterium]
PLWRLQPFLLGSEQAADSVQAGYLRPGLAEEIAGPDAISIFLGLENERAIFALDISVAEETARDGLLGSLGHFRDARTAAQLLPLKDAAILGQAKALIDWHQRHGFCPNCGARTTLIDAGYRRHCEACSADHFPRTDPVVIMLVTDADRVLLGRQPTWPPRRYSALAGFVEPGESLEEAVAREVREEAGVTVGTPRYIASQPWPFPSSLMLGFIAPWESGEPRRIDDELEDVRWFERAEVEAALDERDGPLGVPPRFAIARRLLEHWVRR